MTDSKICKTPFIKWTGSKRTQASNIVDYFPKKFDVYYECFLGGGSVLHELLNRIYEGEISCSKIICTDTNLDLMMLFDMLGHKGLREVLYDFYCERYNEMKKYSGYEKGRITSEQVAKMQEYYNLQRDKYNTWIANKDFPIERAMTFFWLTRTSYNGLVRYNSKGLFNAPFHVNGRMGISPDKLRKVINGWALVIDSFKDNGGDIFFIGDDYANTLKYLDPGKHNVVYMDPPYENSKGMYELPENFSKERLLETIKILNMKTAKVLLSYNGKDGDIDGTGKMEKWYVTHKFIYSGSSSYRRIRLNDTVDKWNVVRDSLYMNF
jgi:DNA adenine methylase